MQPLFPENISKKYVCIELHLGYGCYIDVVGPDSMSELPDL